MKGVEPYQIRLFPYHVSYPFFFARVDIQSLHTYL
jgi:hypothetical protein